MTHLKLNAPTATRTCPKCGGKKYFYAKGCRKCHDYSENSASFHLKPRSCKQCGQPYKPRAERQSKGWCSRKCWYGWLKAHPESATWRKEAGRKGSETLKRMPLYARRRHRLDSNQHEIANALLKYGAGVLSLAQIGGGVPDLAVAYAGETVLMEVKNPNRAYGRNGLTPHQQRFASRWPGILVVVTSVAEALAVLEALGRKPTRVPALDVRVRHYKQTAELPENFDLARGHEDQVAQVDQR